MGFAGKILVPSKTQELSRCYLLPFTGGDPPDFLQGFDIPSPPLKSTIIADADRYGFPDFDEFKRSTIIVDDDVTASRIFTTDADRNGFVDFDEFEHIRGGDGERDGGEVMEDVFRVTDRGRDGWKWFEDLSMYRS